MDKHTVIAIIVLVIAVSFVAFLTLDRFVFKPNQCEEAFKIDYDIKGAAKCVYFFSSCWCDELDVRLRSYAERPETLEIFSLI